MLLFYTLAIDHSEKIITLRNCRTKTHVPVFYSYNILEFYVIVTIRMHART